MAARKHFFLISLLWVLFISGFSVCFAMDEFEPQGKNIRITIQNPRASSDELGSLRATIDEAIDRIVHHHSYILKDVSHVTGWISHKTRDKSDQRDKLFLDALDEAVLYPQGILPTRAKKCFNFLSELWWGAINGTAPGALVPIGLVAGGMIFTFVDTHPWVVWIPFACMLPSCIRQGVNLAKSMRQFMDPRGLKSIKPQELKIMDRQETTELLQEKKARNIQGAGEYIALATELTKDTEPYLLPYKNRNLHRFLSLFASVWENWKYALFFWYIERYTYDTRLWRSCFIVPYIIHSVGKDYNYLANYFEKENTKSENKSFSKVNLEEKKILRDSLRIAKHLINGPESDSLVDSMYQVREKRKNEIELSITVDEALTTYGSDPDTRDQIIHGAIVEYIKKAVPTFNNTWEEALPDSIYTLLTTSFMHDQPESFKTKMYNFIKEKTLYFKVQTAVEKTLKNKPVTWNNELEEAVYEYLRETKNGEEQALEERCSALKENLEKYSIQTDVFMGNLSMDNEGLTTKETFFEEKTESAVSLYLLRAKVPPSKLKQEKLGAEHNFIKDLQSQSTKSKVKPVLEETSKVSLSFNSYLRFIVTFWAAKLMLGYTGADPTTAFYGSLVLAALDSVLGIIKNWYPQQQEFAEIRNINSQKDFKHCRLGSKLVCGVVPAAFTTAATAGIVLTELENSAAPWLIGLLLVKGLWSEFILQSNFFGTHVDEIVTEVVTRIPMPESLQTAQRRAILNRDLKTVEQTIDRLAEPSMKRLYEMWPKNAIEEARQPK